MKRITGLGQCSYDLIVPVERFPREDHKTEVKGLTLQGGGPVATALVALTRLGARCTFIGLVASDAAGVEIRRGLRAAGVDTEGVVVRKRGASQTAFIVTNEKTGARTIFWQRPTCAEIRPDEVKTSLIKGRDFLLIDGLMVKASLKAARAARRLKVPVMIDAGTMRPGMLELSALCDYIVCSERFARELAGTPVKAIKRLTRLGPRAVTVTLGPRGSVTLCEGRKIRTRAYPVRAVDSTGAGDVFHAGLIYGITEGFIMEEALEFASAFAALKCTRPGGRTGIPTLKKTLELMRRG